MFKNYKQGKAYLDSFINYENKSTIPYKESLKLERVHLLLERLNIPYGKLKVIHIAGTKGKGSTAGFCAYALGSLGYSVGVYTSPHVFDFRERISIICRQKNGIESCLIKENEFLNILGEFKDKLDKFLSSNKENQPTFFEIFTAIAFKYFINKGTDYVVLETGLGGRLDSTNVVFPLVSIITHISYDHVKELGSKLENIAYEKAGIIKKGIPLICSSQRPSVLKVIKRKCRIEKANVFQIKKDDNIINLRVKKNMTFFDFKFLTFRFNNLKIRLKGEYQAENAACALAAVTLLEQKKIDLFKAALKRGISEFIIPGRFDIISNNPKIVIDIAHNELSFKVLRRNLELYFPFKKIILIFACSKNKDAKNMLNKIDRSDIILTKFNNSRAVDPIEIHKVCQLKNAIITRDIKEALIKAEEIYKKDSVIVISGSVFLVSDAFKEVRKRKQY